VLHEITLENAASGDVEDNKQAVYPGRAVLKVLVRPYGELSAEHHNRQAN
jgi:hypothetical protein